jgi:ABC-type lipoprotein release transport system permease subunit
VNGTFPRLLGWVLELHVPVAEATATAGLVLAVALLAALLPARRAARLAPAVALHYE